MANRIQLRRDTAANWTRVNPILEDGEPGLEIDTKQVKFGDGDTAWQDLPYHGYDLTKQNIVTNEIYTTIATPDGMNGIGIFGTGATIGALVLQEGDSNFWWSTFGDTGLDYNDDWGSCVAYDGEGNMIVAGGTYDSNFGPNPNSIIIKYDPQGNIIWQRWLTDWTEPYTYISAIWVDSVDNIYITAENDNTNWSYVIKLLPDGSDWSWENTIQASGPIYPGIESMDAWEDTNTYSNSRLYTVGVFYTPGYNTAYVASYDFDGTLQWQNYIDAGNNLELQAVVAHNTGAYIVGNYYDGTYTNGYVASVATDSSIVWQYTFKAQEQGGKNTQPWGIDVDSQGNLIIVGYINDNQPPYFEQLLVTKLSSTGTLIWSKTYSGQEQSYNMEGISVRCDTHGNLIVLVGTDDRPARNYYNGLAILKLDSNGKILWSNVLGGNEGDTDYYYTWGHREIALHQDYIAISGYTYVGPTNPSTNYSDLIAAQLPSDGSKLGAIKNNLYYDPIVLTEADVSLTFFAQTWVMSDASGYLNISQNNDNSSIQLSTYNGSNNLSRFGGQWLFMGGDIWLPEEGDILTTTYQNGVTTINSAIHDLIQNDQHQIGADYVLQLSDRGKHIYMQGNYNIRVPANSQLLFPVGSVITIINAGGNGDLYIVPADNGNNTEIYGAGTDYYYTQWNLPSNSIATLVKVHNNGSYGKWLLSGIGITHN